MTNEYRAWEYRRVSDEHTGQDPARQGVPNGRWAEEYGVELVGVTEEAVSSKKVPNPFDRPGFQEAVRRATEVGCDAILVEEVDRFSRPREEGVAAEDVIAWKRDLRVDHGLRLWVSKYPLDQQGGVIAVILQGLDGAQASADNVKRSNRVSQTWERKRAAAREENRRPDIGRVPELTAAEVRFARSRHEPGRVGYRTVAHEINQRRGVFDVVKPERRRELMVSHTTVGKAIRGERPYDDLGAVRARRAAARGVRKREV